MNRSTDILKRAKVTKVNDWFNEEKYAANHEKDLKRANLWGANNFAELVRENMNEDSDRRVSRMGESETQGEENEDCGPCEEIGLFDSPSEQDIAPPQSDELNDDAEYLRKFRDRNIFKPGRKGGEINDFM